MKLKKLLLLTGAMVLAMNWATADDLNPTVEEYKASHQEELFKRLGINKSSEANYLYQRGVYWLDNNRDYFKANEWFELAADLGHAGAQLKLGHAYDYGLGVRQNKSTAIEWYFKAAEQNEPQAQVRIGMMYHIGEVLRGDREKAKSWYGLACDNGSQVGCNNYRKLNKQ